LGLVRFNGHFILTKRGVQDGKQATKVYARVPERETLEKVTGKIGGISVFGGLDGVLKDLVKIRG